MADAEPSPLSSLAAAAEGGDHQLVDVIMPVVDAPAEASADLPLPPAQDPLQSRREYAHTLIDALPDPLVELCIGYVDARWLAHNARENALDAAKKLREDAARQAAQRAAAPKPPAAPKK